jgi:hypothetical protein
MVLEISDTGKIVSADQIDFTRKVRISPPRRLSPGVTNDMPVQTHNGS